MTQFELGLYGLATHLGKMVSEIEGMSYEEYLGWVEYLSVKTDPDNLLDNPDALLKGLTG